MSGEVVVAGGRIVSVSSGALRPDAIDLGDRWLAPGFIDTHVHGGGGAQFNDRDVDGIAAAARFHAEHGTTGLLATLVPAPLDELCVSLQAIAASGAPNVLGVHLEGPFLSPGSPGALDPALLLVPDRAVLDRLLGVAPGLVRMVTVAPELPGALELIEAVVAAGAIASLGHSDASYAQAVAAVDAGARSVTHIFNAMPPLHHREPDLLGAALDRTELSCELIADGVHADPVALRLAHRAKGPDGIRLITDAIAATGMPDGRYPLGAREVTVADGRARLDGALAGSTLTVNAAVANAVQFLGIDVPAGVALASAAPAALLGLGARKGAIAPGFDADLVVLDDGLRAVGTMVAGAWLAPLHN